jgi:hypothetical protein
VVPNAAVIMVIRDPISRAWSQFNRHISLKVQQSFTPNRSDRELAAAIRMRMTDPNEIEAFMSSESFRRRAYPSRIYRNWVEGLGAERIKPIFFQDLTSRPRHTFKNITRFVLERRNLPAEEFLARDGALPEPPVNRREQHIRIPIEPAQKTMLVDFFAEEITACRELFGEPVLAWANT